MTPHSKNRTMENHILLQNKNKTKIRYNQLHCKISPFFKKFIEQLLECKVIERNYFLYWLAKSLQNAGKGTITDLHNQYEKSKFLMITSHNMEQIKQHKNL